MPDDSGTLTSNQLVGYNLARIRKALGLSQEEAAARLEPYLPGKRWSKNVYSAAERSYDGNRVRGFTADELVAMSLAFGVPVAYFLLPPRPEDRPDQATFIVGKSAVDWRALFDVMFDGLYHANVFHRALELPADERPEPNSRAGVALSQLSQARVSIWDEKPGPYTADDPRFRNANELQDGED